MKLRKTIPAILVGRETASTARRTTNLCIHRITLAALALVTAAATASDFHVASNGNDADPGTKEKPFATTSRAMRV